MVIMVIEGQLGVFHMPQSMLIEMYIVALLMCALAVWRHGENLKRLAAGEERKTYLFKKK